MGHIFTDSGFTIVSSQLKYRPTENSPFHPSLSDKMEIGNMAGKLGDEKCSIKPS